MLYISTRDRTDSFTSHRALYNDRTPDGGMFVPMRIPDISRENILALKERSFTDVIAYVLNLFFDKKITGWDIDLHIGKSPYKLQYTSHRIVAAQMWNNHGGQYAYFERGIYDLYFSEEKSGTILPQWVKIATRIAVLFALHTRMLNDQIREFDVAVPADDFSDLISCWYARKMGLPIGKILCGCDGKSGIWDLVHRGECSLPANGSVGPGMECLMFDAFGRQLTEKYLDICNCGGVFRLTADQRAELDSVIFVAVCGKQRIYDIIRSFSQSGDLFLEPAAAMAYCALQDYRFSTGESKQTLLILDKSSSGKEKVR